MALGEQMNETVAMASESSPADLTPVSFAGVSSVSAMESDYAVEQKRSSPFLWLEQPSLIVGRGLALVAAAVYGTNFASVKILSDSLPVSLSASLRFGIGAVVYTSFVLLSERWRDEKEAGDQYFQVYEAGEEVIPVSKAELYKERTDATWAGAEVGLWYAIGYICQAIALLEVDASKVSKITECFCNIQYTFLSDHFRFHLTECFLQFRCHFGGTST